MYVKHCRLTRFQQLRLMGYFVAGTPARIAADLVSVHRNSAIRFFHKLRHFWKSDSISPSKARWESLYAAGNQRKRRYAITCSPAVC